MAHDPLTIVVNLDKDGNAGGALYLDDGETTGYLRGMFVHRFFMFTSQDNILRSRSVHPGTVSSKAFEKSIEQVRVEKIIIIGFDTSKLRDGQLTVEAFQDKKSWNAQITVTPSSNGKASTVVVRNPNVYITSDWSIQI